MLKRLAIVVFFAIVLPVHGQKESPEPGSNKNGGDGSQSPPSTPSGTATCVVKQEGTAIECHWPESKPESYLKRLFSPENAPNIGLFCVGLGGVGAAVFTLLAIKRQADLMKDQLEVMKRQAEIADRQMALMFRKERGELQIEGGAIDIMNGVGDRREWIIVASIKLTNAGNLPLRIFGGSGECLILRNENHLPPVYGRKLNQTSLLNTWIRPKDGGASEGVLSEDIREDPAKFMKMAMIYEGRRIILRGIFDYESHGAAWRRFYGFEWVSYGQDFEQWFAKGRWEECTNIENEEYEIPAPPQVPF